LAINPCGHRLVVKPFKQVEVDEVLKKAKQSGFLDKFEIINSNQKREDASVDVGTILSIGPTAWADFGGTPWAKVGDRILFAKFAGKFVDDPETKESVCILNDEDVVAVVTGGGE
jgi:co-chaperonin GroES (HSP10)